MFVSYASHDQDAVLGPSGVVPALRKHGVRAWVAPEQIHQGQDYAEEIGKALVYKCGALLLFLSKHSLNSAEVASEVAIAFKQRMPILPVCLEHVELPAKWVYRLGRWQYIFVEDGAEAIVHALQRHGVLPGGTIRTGTAEPATTPPAPPAKHVPRILPFLVDRAKQDEALESAFEDAVATRRPLSVIVPGPVSEGLTMYAERVVGSTLNRFLKRRKLASAIHLCQPKWPTCDDPSDSVERRIDRLRHRLCKEVAPRGRQDLREVHRALSKRGESAAIRMFAPAEGWSGDELAFFDAWHRELEALPRWPRRGLLISTVVVEYAPSWWPWSAASRGARRARSAMRELMKRSTDRVQVVVVPELEPIPVEDIELWVRQEVVPWLGGGGGMGGGMGGGPGAASTADQGTGGFMVRQLRSMLDKVPRSGRAYPMIEIEPVLADFLKESTGTRHV